MLKFTFTIFEVCNALQLIVSKFYVLLNFQVVLMLTSDLDADEEKDRAALDALLNALLKELDLSGKVGLKLLTPLNPFLVLMLTSDLDADEERQSCP